MYKTPPEIVASIMAARPAVLLAVLLLSTTLAGCNVQDWYNHMGTVNVSLAPTGVQESRIGDFQTVSVALYGVSVKQVDSINTKEFSYGDQPLVVDLAKLARDRERLPITQFKMNLRAVETITLRMEVLEAVDASGRSLEICRPGDEIERFPCFAVPDNGAYVYDDKPFSPQRGRVLNVGLPLDLQYLDSGPRNEYYFLAIDPNRLVLETA